MSILTSMSLVNTAITCHFPPLVYVIECEVCLVSDDIYNNNWVFIRSLLTLGISIEYSPKLNPQQYLLYMSYPKLWSLQHMHRQEMDELFWWCYCTHTVI